MYESMTPVVINEVIHLNTSKEVWKALEELFGVINRSRINQLRTSLLTTRKGRMKISKYLAVMKKFVDDMNIASETVSNEYLMSSVLAGLDMDYLPVFCHINAKDFMT